MKTDLSVGELVQFLLKTGDLISENPSKHTAKAGIKLHQKIQKQQQKKYPDYLKEETLSFTYQGKNHLFHLKGRMDGWYQDPNDQLEVVEEIKTSEEKYALLTVKKKEQYFAQGLCYGYFLAMEKNLSLLKVKLTYVEVISQTTYEEIKVVTKDELATFFKNLMTTYEKWVDFLEKIAAESFTSIETLDFPYPKYRKGQKKLMGVVYKANLKKRQLFLEAPTGTGKTLSTLFPSIKLLPEKKYQKIFYLTAKTITRTVALEALTQLQKSGLKCKAIVLTAKDKICFQKHDKDNPYLYGYYDRVNEALMDCLAHEDLLTFEVIQRYAKKHTLCPFEFSLDLSLFCQIIICDYNYVYDPTVYLKRYFDEMTAENAPLLLVDESHNLVSRSKEMYSKSLSLKESKAAYRIFKEEKIKETLTNKVNRKFRKLLQALEDFTFAYEAEFTVEDTFPEKFRQLLSHFTEEMWKWIGLHEVKDQEKLVDWLQNLQGFLKVAELFNDEFKMIYEKSNQDFSLKVLCLDASSFLKSRHEQSYNSILFSATLQPVDYFKERLGEVEAYSMSLSSPFPKENQQVIITDYIATTYQKRGENLEKIIDALYLLGKTKKGNYFIFCPSYTFMLEIFAAFQKKYPDSYELLLQEKELTEEKRLEFLAAFKENNPKSLLAFALLGGIFSEGIDLKGQRLIGCAIIGVGLPQINPYLDLEKAYYEEKSLNGFNYAYRLPGMNKVLQGVGRVIRSSHDLGVVLLLDQRYVTRQYQIYLPPYWQIGVAKNFLGVKEGLEQFWQNHVF